MESNGSDDIEFNMEVDFNIAKNIFKKFESAKGLKDVSQISSDVADGIIELSYVYSDIHFKAEIHITRFFSMIRIINAFDFSSTKDLQGKDLKNKANNFNLSAIGLKAVVMNKTSQLVHFCAEWIFFEDNIRPDDIYLNSVILASAPLNFVSIAKG